MHKEYINAKCIARSRGCTALANAKLTSALSSRNAKSLKRVLSGEAKLSLYLSDSYPIHYTAGYPIYYAQLIYIYIYIYRATYTLRPDNFIPTREFWRGTREYYAFSSSRSYVAPMRISRREWKSRTDLRRNDITRHKFYSPTRKEGDEG